MICVGDVVPMPTRPSLPTAILTSPPARYSAIGAEPF